MNIKDIEYYLSGKEKIHPLLQILPGDLPDGIPGSCSADQNYRYHHKDKIKQLHLNGICINDISPYAAAQPDEAEFLL